MKALLAIASLGVSIFIIAFVPTYGAPSVLFCLILSAVVMAVLGRLKEDKEFLLPLFVAGLLVRMLVATLIFSFNFQEFFGGDAFTYDHHGKMMANVWRGDVPYHIFQSFLGVYLTRNWGMIYVVGAIYTAFGNNMLAVQVFSAVLGAATAPVIYICAKSLFQNTRVARISSCFVAFYPSLVLWSSQGLKDGPLVFLLAISMLATLKLSERLSARYMAILAGALFGIFTLRFYIFYMMVAAIAGSFLLGLGKASAKGFMRQFVIIVGVGLAMAQLGVWQSAEAQFEVYGNLEAVQRSRLDLATSGQSGFGQDVDVSTTEGALTIIPVGMIYLLFAPFPWQLASLRQSITLPEMVVWWVSFPFLVMGLWYTLKFRARQALPILIFTTMLTIAYAVFQGNVGTAYRQRSQLLIFYFIFVGVGYALIKERREALKSERHGQASAGTVILPARVPAFPRRQIARDEPQPAFLVDASQAPGVRVPPAARGDATIALPSGREVSSARPPEKFRQTIRAYFLSHPAATEADFERCWAGLRDEIFRQHTMRVLRAEFHRWEPMLYGKVQASLYEPNALIQGSVQGNGQGNGSGSKSFSHRSVD